jgi:hypothetical protein
MALLEKFIGQKGLKIEELQIDLDLILRKILTYCSSIKMMLDFTWLAARSLQ